MREQVGRIVVLNGAPRSGKSSIVAELQRRDAWLSLGVDVYASVTPPGLKPGIGLRPGGERADLEGHVARLFSALYESVAAHSRLGFDVVVDVGHHDSYAGPLRTLADAARRLEGLPAYLIGVRCPVEVIMQRRDAGLTVGDGERGYVTSGPGGEVPAPVLRWERTVHDPGIYDVEVDTGALRPPEAADVIEGRLRAGPPKALAAILRR